MESPDIKTAPAVWPNITSEAPRRRRVTIVYVLVRTAPSFIPAVATVLGPVADGDEVVTGEIVH